jgi:hypothetical protein
MSANLPQPTTPPPAGSIEDLNQLTASADDREPVVFEPVAEYDFAIAKAAAAENGLVSLVK